MGLLNGESLEVHFQTTESCQNGILLSRTIECDARWGGNKGCKIWKTNCIFITH